MDGMAVEASNILKKELAYYKEHRDELLRQYEGKFVLIKEDKLLGVFDTDAAAYEEGIKRLGNTTFLIKAVLREEEPMAMIPALSLGILYASP